MINANIINAEVHIGFVTFIHAQLKDQSLDTLKALGRGKQAKETRALIYDLDFTHQVILWS